MNSPASLPPTKNSAKSTLFEKVIALADKAARSGEPESRNWVVRLPSR